MFSKTITSSSSFLMMPSSAQNLYFHLGMNADDDGFCEHFSIMRMTDSKPDDLKILQAKRFVQVFDDRVLVITNWTENNYIQKDRYTPSKYLIIYKKELKQLSNGIQNVYKVDTQVRLGKDRLELGKDKEEATTSVAGIPEIFKVFEEKNPAIKRMYGNKTQRGACERLIVKFGLEKVIGYAKFAIKVLGMPYAPRVTTPYLLETKWADLEAFYHESINKQESKGKEILGL